MTKRAHFGRSSDQERRSTQNARILTSTVNVKYESIEINDLMERPMAGNLHVRNLDDDLIARLKRRAARHGRSTEAEHREILRQALIGDVEHSFDTLAADLRNMIACILS
jgi:antitoxin FitA